MQALNLSQIGRVAVAGLGVTMTQLTRQDLTPCAGNSVAGSVPAYNPQAARSALARRQRQGPLPDRRGHRLRARRRSSPSSSCPPPASRSRSTRRPRRRSAARSSARATGTSSFIGIGVANPSQLDEPALRPGAAERHQLRRHRQRRLRGPSRSRSRRVGAAGCKYWLDGERALFRTGDVAPMSVFTDGVSTGRAWRSPSAPPARARRACG